MLVMLLLSLIYQPLCIFHPFFFSALNAGNVDSLPCLRAISMTIKRTKSDRIQ